MTKRSDDGTAGSDEDEQKGPEQLREETTPFQSGVVEVDKAGKLESK